MAFGNALRSLTIVSVAFALANAAPATTDPCNGGSLISSTSFTQDGTIVRVNTATCPDISVHAPSTTSTEPSARNVEKRQLPGTGDSLTVCIDTGSVAELSDCDVLNTLLSDSSASFSSSPGTRTNFEYGTCSFGFVNALDETYDVDYSDLASYAMDIANTCTDTSTTTYGGELEQYPDYDWIFLVTVV